jgi:hypothetical protein
MLDGRADDVLALFDVAEPPDLHAWGQLDGSETRYNFTGRAIGPLHFLGFPLDQGSVSCVVEGTTVKMDQINFSAAGGTGHMRATLAGPMGERRLGFDLFGSGMKLSRAIHAFEEYEALSTGKPYSPSPDGKFVRKAGNSQLDFSVSAQGLPGDLKSFTGSGNASLTGAELGEVHLFGLLSQVLSGLTLNFSSLKLDAVRTSFQLRDGVAYFPDLKVTGPSAVIDGRGRYSYAARTLELSWNSASPERWPTQNGRSISPARCPAPTPPICGLHRPSRNHLDRSRSGTLSSSLPNAVIRFRG